MSNKQFHIDFVNHLQTVLTKDNISIAISENTPRTQNTPGEEFLITINEYWRYP